MSPTTAAHVRADLGADVRVVLDGGPCRVGVESTIVDVTGGEPAILRVGGVSRAAIERSSAAGRTAYDRRDRGAGHARRRITRRDATWRSSTAEEVGARARDLSATGRRVGLLVMRPVPPDLPGELVVLDAPVDVEEYARVLYARLREADDRLLDVLLVVIPPASDGLGAAVADRVCRASH